MLHGGVEDVELAVDALAVEFQVGEHLLLAVQLVEVLLRLLAGEVQALELQVTRRLLLSARHALRFRGALGQLAQVRFFEPEAVGRRDIVAAGLD